MRGSAKRGGMQIGVLSKGGRGRGLGERCGGRDICSGFARLGEHVDIDIESVIGMQSGDKRTGRTRVDSRGAPRAGTKLDGAVAKGTFDGGATVSAGVGGMDEAIALVAKGVALGLAVDGGGGVVAVFAEGEGGDGGGEVDAVVIGV